MCILSVSLEQFVVLAGRTAGSTSRCLRPVRMTEHVSLGFSSGLQAVGFRAHTSSYQSQAVAFRACNPCSPAGLVTVPLFYRPYRLGTPFIAHLT